MSPFFTRVSFNLRGSVACDWGKQLVILILKHSKNRSKILYLIINTPWIVSNKTIHDELDFRSVKNLIQSISLKYKLVTAQTRSEA